MPAALDPVPLMKHLEEHGVEYVVIGGLAVGAHGHVRPSMDLDIVPSPSHENLIRLAAALVDANAVDAGADELDRAGLPMSATRVDLVQGENFRLLTDLGDLDVFQWASGIEAADLYAELDREALTGSVEGVSVRVCSLDHLRAMKRAAGRPQHLEDLRRLGED
jgi:hypothetical protein